MQQTYLLLFSLLVLGCVSVYANESQTKVSYAFAVDDTGSMGNEINAVKEGIKDLLRIAPDAVANYVVVLFNDPNIGPFIKSSNNADIVRFVNNIRHHGGGDCPEMAMTGLRKAIELSDRGSFIFFFSDASAKDYHLHPVVSKAAKAKDIMILFVLTGCCSKCNSERFKAYKTVTTEVGGRMYQVSKTGAEEFMKYTVVVAAKDALLMKYTPTNFEEVKIMGETGKAPTPPRPPDKKCSELSSCTPAPTPPDNGCSELLSCSTIALIFVTGVLAIITNWSVKNLQPLLV